MKDPMTEIYLLFHQSVLPMFTHFNLLLQREEPCIYLLHDEMNGFLKKLCGKFLSLEEIRNISQLQLLNISNQVADDKLFIGFLIRHRLRQLEDDGSELTKIKSFHCAVRKFYEACFH